MDWNSDRAGLELVFTGLEKVNVKDYKLISKD